jgi:hypothetical protein
MLTLIGPHMKLGAWIERKPADFPDMLFDRVADPLELENVSGRRETAAAEKELREQMWAWIKRTPNAYNKPREPLRP